MKKSFFSVCCSLFICLVACSQIGIGTNAPHPKAALDIKSTDKGVLFPRMTTEQRDAIQDPPDGLHIFNTDERCLNYYDSAYGLWNCYCDNDACKVVVLRISADADSIDFYNMYAKNYPAARKFAIEIDPGVTIRGGIRVIAISGLGTIFISRPSLDFSNMPDGSIIKIINRGSIYGHGGVGGEGATGDATTAAQCINVVHDAASGGEGGAAIQTKSGVVVNVENYGIIAGGGGGGGGGGRNTTGEYGGGGGGGAGTPSVGGIGGGRITVSCFLSICVCVFEQHATSGTSGTITMGGAGGIGANNGGNGGKGGDQGQPGEAGTGTNAGSGGAVGKAIGGGSGNSLFNTNGGTSFGLVD